MTELKEVLESRFAKNEKVALDGAPRGDVAQHVRESALAPHSAKAASGHGRSFKVTQLSRRTISGNMARCGNSEADKSRPMLDLKQASAPSYAQIAY